MRFRKLLEYLLDFLFPLEKRDVALFDMEPAELLRRITFPEVKTTNNVEVTALFRYDDPVIKNALWALKYRNSQRAAALLGVALADVCKDIAADAFMFGGGKKPLLLPIPLSRERLNERGYNQVARVLKEAAPHLNESCIYSDELLIRTKHNPPQTSLSREKRMENLKGAFSVTKPEQVKNQTIILVDDVVTTGSTLAEAERALRKAGAREVVCVALAH